MKWKTTALILVALAVLLGIMYARQEQAPQKPSQAQATDLTVAISPYQDIAMLVNAEPLGLPKKYGVNLHLVTLAWEDILPTVSSAGRSVDIGFGSLVEFLTKYGRISGGSADPIVFVQPLYVYNGGGFVGLDPKLAPLDGAALKDPKAAAAFLKLRIGAQKQSLYEMMIYSVARRAGVPLASIKLFDTPMNDGLLALESGSLDVTSAGLTQLNEARKYNGRMILSMKDSGFADVTGFICRRSVLEQKRGAIEALIRMWFASVDYVLADPQKNSAVSLDYLRKNSATQYTFDEYASALSQEYLPRSLNELQSNVLADGSKYDWHRLSQDIGGYLVENKIVEKSPIPPDALLAQ